MTRSPPEDAESTGSSNDGPADSGSSSRPGASPGSSEEAAPAPASPRLTVGVGASAGGLDAYKDFLSGFQSESGLAFVFILHLDPVRESLMSEILDKHSPMPVIQIEDGMRVQADHVYVIPPNKFVTIRDDTLLLEPPIKARGIRLPIDHFLRSLAEDRSTRSAGVILSGTGSDGTLGIQEIKRAGGLVLVQDPDAADHDGMPRSAIQTGQVDLVVGAGEMAQALRQYAAHPWAEVGEGGDDGLMDGLPEVFSLLEAHSKNDFARYKSGTINRRIQRRMGLGQFDRLADYVQVLKEDPEEVDHLFRDLLIGVTSFFRDPEVWKLIESRIGAAVGAKEDGDAFRIWVPGCATGEEAYSLAMVALEQMELQRRQLNLQVFATDIDSRGLQRGRAATYPSNIVADVPPQRLRRFFNEVESGFSVTKKVREACVFAEHNLIRDPPFSQLDVVSCRNVLIYLEPEAQDQVLAMFHFALRDEGTLILGASESMHKSGNLFAPVDGSARVFRRLEGRRLQRPDAFSAFETPRRASLARGTQPGRGEPHPDRLAEEIRSTLLREFAPAAVVVDRRGDVVHYSGPVRDYLDFPTGGPTAELFELAMRGLKGRLRTAIDEAFRSSEVVRTLAPRVIREGVTVRVDLAARALSTRESPPEFVLVTFQDAPIQLEESDRTPGAYSESEAVQQLEAELRITREDLQSTIETLEASNEELKASNEEITSMNEEFQSTNEELTTSREELQSLNEELSTVNTQLEDKIEQLETTNDDLQNLLRSSAIPTIFLNTDLEIRRFSDSASNVFHFIPGDVGRPITDLKRGIDDPGLVEDARTVLDQLTPIERNVRSEDGRAFLRRTLPYRTSEDKIDGVVVTYTDVDQLHQAVDVAQRRELQHRAAAALGALALGTDDLDAVFDKAVATLVDVLDVEFSKVLQLLPDEEKFLLRAGRGWDSAIVPGEELVSGGSGSQAGFTFDTAAPVIVEDLRQESRFSGPPLLRDHGVVSGMSVVIGPVAGPWGVLGAHSAAPRTFTVDDVSFLQTVAHILANTVENVSNRAKIRDREGALERRYAELEAVFAHAPVGLALLDARGTYLRLNETLAQINGTSPEESLGKTVADLLPELGPELQQQLQVVADSGVPVTQAVVQGLTPADPGTERFWLLDLYPIPTSASDPLILGVVQDITEETRLEQVKAAETEISIALASATSIVDALPEIFQAVAEQLHIAVGEWWEADADGYIRCVQHAVLDSDAERRLPPDWFEQRFAVGQGLIGRVWSEARPLYVDDVQNDSDFVRGSDGATGLGSGFALPILGPDGVSAVLALFSPLHLTNGDAFLEVVGRIGTAIQQFQGRLRADAALRSALDAEAASNRAKSEFLANMSHEIRTPMTAILGFAEFLRDRVEGAENVDMVQVIQSNGKHLLSILDDILDLSRVEAGHLELKTQDFVPTELTAAVLELMERRASQKGLDLSVEFEGAMPTGVRGDAVRIRQVLLNLVSNAIKFTESGGVRVTVHFQRRPRAHLTFQVRDTGIGIRDEDKKRLFEPFYQADSSDRREYSGTGLGLAISKRLADLLDGELTVESAVGEGSTFRFVAPVQVDANVDLVMPARGAGTAEAPRLDGHYLVVEDHAEVATLLRRILEEAGADAVKVASTGRDALRAVEETPHAFHGIVMDMQMPEMDGYEAARRLRDGGYGGPIVAVTARTMEGDAEKSMAAGCDVHLAKPVDRLELLSTLARLGGGWSDEGLVEGST